MLHARPFVGGVPLYRQVQSGIDDMIRANPRAKAIPLSGAQFAERFGVSRITVRRAVDEPQTRVGFAPIGRVPRG